MPNAKYLNETSQQEADPGSVVTCESGRERVAAGGAWRSGLPGAVGQAYRHDARCMDTRKIFVNACGVDTEW